MGILLSIFCFTSSQYKGPSIGPCGTPLYSRTMPVSPQIIDIIVVIDSMDSDPDLSRESNLNRILYSELIARAQEIVLIYGFKRRVVSKRKKISLNWFGKNNDLIRLF